MSQSTSSLIRTAGSVRMRTIWLCIVVGTLIACTALPALASGGIVAHNTPAYVGTAKNLGSVDPTQVIEVSLWLTPRNRAAMDQLAANLYDKTSPSYRHFLSQAQIAARFAPTAADAQTVREFLTAHNLTIVKMGPNNFYVRARGTVGAIESAFRVGMNNYSVQGTAVRANDRDPYIEGDAYRVVSAVYGLDGGAYTHPSISKAALLQKAAPSMSKSMAAQVAHQADASFYTNNCFPGTETDVFTTNNDGEQPVATYKGNVLGEETLTSAGCGYTPPMIQTAYNLNQLYAAGWDGTGQTIGIIDWCGSLTIQNDANAFAAMFGLPPLTSSNFAITYTPTPSLCEAVGDIEINLDVEWAHAVAPGANINLIVPPSAEFVDVDEAEFTAINDGLANVLSGSYGSPEAFTSPSITLTESMISEIGAISGISTNFSSADDGDYSVFGITTVSAPADSPWATGVGGITLALNSDNSIAWQTGWGNNQGLLAEEGFVSDPPAEEAFGFIGGAGGGPSDCVEYTIDPTTGVETCTAGFAKPAYQIGVPGKARQVPDVSWLADPYAGVAVAITESGQVPGQIWTTIGGTSVATPMFSALWAIANQAAGEPLGLAAPYLYQMPAGAIMDIKPVTSKTNVKGSIVDSNGTTAYTSAAILGGDAPALFVTAIWDYPYEQETGLILSFGTDCSIAGPAEFFGTQCNSPTALHTKEGWDNVTGVGVPNGWNFVSAFAPAPSVKKQ